MKITQGFVITFISPETQKEARVVVISLEQRRAELMLQMAYGNTRGLVPLELAISSIYPIKVLGEY